MNQWLGKLRPNRIDGYLAALVVLYLMAILTPILAVTIDSDSLHWMILPAPYFSGLVCFIALFATQSWASFRKNILGLVLAVGSVAVLVGVSQFARNWTFTQSGDPASPYAQFCFDVAHWNDILTVIAVLAGVVLGTRLFCWSGDWAISRIKSSTVTRPGAFIVCAVMMYGGAMLITVVPIDFLNGFQIRVSNQMGMVLASANGMIAIAGSACVFSRIGNGPGAVLLAGGILFVAGAIFSNMSVYAFNQYLFFRDQAILMSVLFGSTFCFIAMLIRRPVDPNVQRANTPGHDEVHESSEQRLPWPSIGGYSVVGLFLAGIVFIVLFDIGILVNHSRSGRFRAARVARRLHWKQGTNSRVRHISNLSFGVDVEFLSDADPGYFAPLLGLSKNTEIDLWLHGITSKIDTGIIRLRKKKVRIFASQISLQQLDDFNSGSTRSIRLSGDCSLVGSRTLVPPANQPTLFNLSFSQLAPGNLSSFLDVVRLGPRIDIRHSQLNDDDWNAILDVPPLTRVTLERCSLSVSPKLLARLNHPDMEKRNLFFKFPAPYETDIDPWALLLDTRLKLERTTFRDSQEAWDACLAGRVDSFQLEGIVKALVDTSTFAMDIRKYHLAMDGDDSEPVRQLFIPDASEKMVKRVADFTDLEFLSLDNDWLDGSGTLLGTGLPSDFSPLSRLTSLKELYLPEAALIDDFSFLRNHSDLEVLQFDAFHDQTIGNHPNFNAGDCPHLKQVILFNHPHASLLDELGKLPMLEKLTMVTWQSGSEVSDSRNSIKELLGEMLSASVEVEFIDSSKGRVEIPRVFKEHLIRVRADIRRRRLPEEEP